MDLIVAKSVQWRHLLCAFLIYESNIDFTCKIDLSNMWSNAGNWKQEQAGKAPHGSAPGINNRHINVAEPLLSVKCPRRDHQGWMRLQGHTVHVDLLTSWRETYVIWLDYTRSTQGFKCQWRCRYNVLMYVGQGCCFKCSCTHACPDIVYNFCGSSFETRFL
jgi:hypothetical protein